jgi:hypothetical protein
LLARRAAARNKIGVDFHSDELVKRGVSCEHGRRSSEKIISPSAFAVSSIQYAVYSEAIVKRAGRLARSSLRRTRRIDTSGYSILAGCSMHVFSRSRRTATLVHTVATSTG